MLFGTEEVELLFSMTGYGAGRAEGPDLDLRIEIRTLNNKGLDINVRVPRGFLALEDLLRRRVRLKLTRGRVDVFLDVIDCPPPAVKVRVHHELAREYQQALRGLQQELDLQEGLRLGELMRLPEVLQLVTAPPDTDQLAPYVEQAMDGALHQVEVSREAEGTRLHQDLELRLEALESSLGRVEQRAPELARESLERLRAGLRKLVGDLEPDARRLEQEAALLADRGDVTEELVRLRSHLARFRELLDNPQGRAVGRELEFLAQELLREVNTTGSKISDAECLRDVLGMKGEINRLREQVQNLE